MKSLLLIVAIVSLGGCAGMPVAQSGSARDSSRVPVVTQLPRPGERRTAMRLMDEERAAQNRTHVDGVLVR